MGNQPQQPQAPKPTLEDTLIDMKMTGKRFESESRRAEKEKKQQLEKARQAIRKGNEEGAKLFLALAMTKQKESEQSLKMAHKMDAMSTVIKGCNNQTNMTDMVNKINPLLQQQAMNVPIEQLYNQMTEFEKSMDQINVQGKVMDEVLNKNSDSNSDDAVTNMMAQMKQEMYNEINTDLNTGHMELFNDLKNPNAQMNSQKMKEQK